MASVASLSLSPPTSFVGDSSPANAHELVEAAKNAAIKTAAATAILSRDDKSCVDLYGTAFGKGPHTPPSTPIEDCGYDPDWEVFKATQAGIPLAILKLEFEALRAGVVDSSELDLW